MLRRKHVFLLFFLALALFLGSTPSEETHGSALVDFLGKSVNFLLLFGGLAFLLAKPLRRFLEELALSIQKTIQETERAKREAEERLGEMRRRLGGLEGEVQKIKRDGEEAGRREKERVLALARQEAERLRTFSRQEIEAHIQAALRELREYAAGLAVSLARGKIEKRLTSELHSRFIDKSIEGIGRIHENPPSD